MRRTCLVFAVAVLLIAALTGRTIAAPVSVATQSSTPASPDVAAQAAAILEEFEIAGERYIAGFSSSLPGITKASSEPGLTPCVATYSRF